MGFTPGTQKIDFGNRTTGAPSRTVTLTLTNSGDANLTLGAAALALSGANASDFSITNSTCSNNQVIAASGTCNIVVTFTPSATAAESASITTASDAASNPTINLAGIGVAASTAPAPAQAANYYGPISISFGGALDGALDLRPAASAFSVSINGSNPVAASYIDIVNGNLEIGLPSQVTVDDAVTIAYSQPQNSAALQDASGNKVASFNVTSVTNTLGICGQTPTSSCVVAVTHTKGGNTATAPNATAYLNSATGWVQAALSNKAQVPGGDLSDASVNADATSVFQIDLKLKNFNPGLLLGQGRNGDWTVGTADANGLIPVSIHISPIAFQKDSTRTASDCSDFSVNDTTTRATDAYNAYVNLLALDLGKTPLAPVAQALKGTILLADAQCVSWPSYKVVGNVVADFNQNIGSPHFKTDGSTLNTGHFEAHVPQALLGVLGINQASDLSASFNNVSNLSVAAEQNVGIKATFDMHYSSGQVAFSKAAAVAPGGNLTLPVSPAAGQAAWLAPDGTSSFTAGATMTTAGSGASSIAAPTTPGTYSLYLLDNSSNVLQTWANAVTVSVPVPSLTYAPCVFNVCFSEAAANDGSINNANPLVITLANDSFSGTNGDDFVAKHLLTVTNLPPGLSAVAKRTDATHLSVTLAGQATDHMAANTTDSITFTFQDGAFAANAAGAVTNYTKSNFGGVSFKDLGGPESALVGADGVTRYVSETLAGKVSAIDANGVRTVIASGLTAPKGLALMNGKLYVADVSRIVEIDLVQNNAATDYVASAAFGGLANDITVNGLSLNDLATDSAGNLYVSDWEANNAIYKVAATSKAVTLVAHNAYGSGMLNEPNGLWAEPSGKLLAVNSGDGKIYRIDLTPSPATTTLLATLPAVNNFSAMGEGLVLGKDNILYISEDAVSNKVYSLDLDNVAGGLQTVASNLITPADINLDATGRYLLIPQQMGNTLTTLRVPSAPDAFAFNAQVNQPTATPVASNTITLAGITSASAKIVISGGEYKIDNGDYTSQAGTVTNGQTVTVRLTSSANANTATVATLTIGGVSSTFTVTTQAAAAPDPTPSYTPSPTPTSTTVAPGSSTTVGNTGGTVYAGAGSTVNVTAGTSGATIDLPTPPTTGATTTSAVNVVIGGNNLSVKPTESGSVVKTATVSIDGKDTTVLNVTTGTAQVTASAANQPLVSVGTGASAVVISSGSASATVITSVDKATGVTSLTLPKSTTGVEADASIKMTIGGQDVNVKPSGGGDVVVTLATVTVNGVSTQVVSVTGGSATVTSSQPNQPLLAVGGGSGSNAIVVTADTAGTAATSTVNVSTGETFIAVSNGVVTLPSNAFAEVGNGFAAIKGGKLYAGEIAVLNAAGKITGVRLGSQSGASANVGDPVTAASAVGLTMNVVVPNLKGKVARVSDTQDFGDVIAASLGAGYIAKGQNSNGVLSLTFPGGGSANAMPIGDITVDTSRADGVTTTGNGKVEVVKSGVIASFAPAVADPAQLAGLAITLDKKASVTVSDYGVLQATINGITYALQPGWVVSKASGGATGFTTDAQGRVVYQDSTGNQQTLYPAFAEMAQLVAAFKTSDANAGATGHDDGTVTAKFQGVTYTLTPDYALIAVLAEHAKDAWWVGADGRVVVKNGDGKTAQGFEVK